MSITSWPNQVTLGTFVADNEADTDSRVTAKVTGWSDAPPVRSSITDRAQQDGGYDAAGLYGPRTVTLEGRVAQATAAAAAAVADALTALAPRSLQTLTVTNASTGARSAQVRIVVGAVLQWYNPQAFSYTLQVKAPDPLKYGAAWSGSTPLSGVSGTGRVWPRVWPTGWGVPAGVTPGQIQVPNVGKAAYWPLLRIDGPVSNPTVVCNQTGDFVTVRRSVLAGQWLDFDLGARRVLLNGQISLRYVTTFGGNWLAVPAGGASYSWSADVSDVNARLTANGYQGAWT